MEAGARGGSGGFGGGFGDGVGGVDEGWREGGRCLVWDCWWGERWVRGRMPCRWGARDSGRGRGRVVVVVVFGGR